MLPQHATMLRRHLEAENAHDLDGTLATLHRDCVFTDHATGQIWTGHEGAAAHYRQWWDCFDVEVIRGKVRRLARRRRLCRGGDLDRDP